jgi:hypothetical protein
MITFVTYYVSLSRQTMDTIHQTTKTITVTEPFRFIETMFESARAFHPSCRCAILTDEATRFPFDDTLPVIRFELDDRQPMLSRSEAWPRYLAQAESHVVFLDSDILINADLEHVFAHDFDVALTYRDEKKWPINAGIQFVHESAVEQARAFYQKWLDEYRTRHREASVWGGDQDVLREMFKQVDFQRTDSFSQKQAGFRFRFLPCSSYNFSSEDEQMTGHYPQKKVLHFKGRRKSAMLPYWQTVVEAGS